MTDYTQTELVANLRRCPRYDRCGRNQCPLDYELDLRHGGGKCAWMTEGAGKPIKQGRGIRTYLAGAQMPDELLWYVPEENTPRLNERSRRRWHEMQSEDIAANAPRTPKSPLIYTENQKGVSVVDLSKSHQVSKRFQTGSSTAEAEIVCLGRSSCAVLGVTP